MSVALARPVLAEQRVHLTDRTSKSTLSFATTPGNLFVIPRIVTAGPHRPQERHEPECVRR